MFRYYWGPDDHMKSTHANLGTPVYETCYNNKDYVFCTPVPVLPIGLQRKWQGTQQVLL